MGHQGSTEKKVQAIEYLDTRVIGPLKEMLDAEGLSYRMLVLPDHPTPVRVRTHTAGSVPYLLYDSTNELDRTWSYNEKEGAASGICFPEGYMLIDHLFSC